MKRSLHSQEGKPRQPQRLPAEGAGQATMRPERRASRAYPLMGLSAKPKSRSIGGRKRPRNAASS
jgi:hypothetical protein